MHVAAILTAAGSGQRLGHALPKALALVDDIPLVVHAARALAESGVVDEIVVTVPSDHQAAFATALTHAGPTLGHVPVTLVVGGATRQASVAAGLGRLGPDADHVLVHDAARPFAPADLVRQVVEALAAGHRVVIPAVPVTDTVVEVRDGAARPVDRTSLRAVQTPQGFTRGVLEQAHAAAIDRSGSESSAATDDASLCAALGERVTVVAGSEAAGKVTTARDLAAARMLFAETAVSAPAGTERATPAGMERAGTASGTLIEPEAAR